MLKNWPRSTHGAISRLGINSHLQISNFKSSAKERINVEEAFLASVKSIISYKKECEEQEESEINGQESGDTTGKKKKFSLSGLFKRKK
jgi:hypothetical protein